MIAVIAFFLDRLLVRGITAGISLYQFLLSPFFGRQCRFYPSCSNYSKEALRCHGALKGTLLTFTRICRCHPFCEGGIDNVPQVFSIKTIFATTTSVNTNNGSQT